MSNTKTNAGATPAPTTGLRGGVLGRVRRIEPSMILWIALIALLLFLVVNPIFRLLSSSLIDAATGDLSIANYITAYGRSRHLQALLNSLWMGAGVVVLSTVFAVPLA